jgi:hypothetical protein
VINEADDGYAGLPQRYATGLALDECPVDIAEEHETDQHDFAAVDLPESHPCARTLAIDPGGT